MASPHSSDLIIEIANKAAPLADYLASDGPVEGGGQTASLMQAAAQKRLETWRETITAGEPGVFERRLKATGLDKAQILNRLGSTLLNSSQSEPLPAWIALLQELFEGSEELFEPASLERSEFRPVESKQVAFDKVLQPFVRLFRRKLEDRLGQQSFQLLTPLVIGKLESDLTEALSELAAPALAVEFSIYKNRSQKGGFLGLFKASPDTTSDPTGPTPDHLYQGFVKKLLDNRLQNFFQEYSALARLLCLKTGYYLDTVAELLERLIADLPEIEKLFGQTGGHLLDVSGGLSDPHDQGRTVYRLDFASGLKLIYKPRDLTLEAAFQNFLKWYNSGQSEQEPLLRTLVYLERKSYGWVEFVEHLACHDEQQVRNYYRRCGILLSILYVLQAKDYHYENLIACGEFPVPIDQEALMAPLPAPPGETQGPDFNLEDQFLSSVLSIGILPAWEVTASGHVRDIGAMGEASENDRAYLKVDWQNINTDRMQAVPLKEFITGSAALNRPVFQGKGVGVGNYVDEFSAGFEHAYRHLLTTKEILLSDNGPLQIFKGLKERVILRPTRVYGTLLNQGNSVRLMMDGLKRSFHFDRLSKAFLFEGTNSWRWPVLNSEIKSLEQLDLPFFYGFTDSTALFLGVDNSVPGYFKQSGFEAVKATLERLGEADFQLQLRYVQTSFYMIGKSSLTPVKKENPDPAPGEQVRFIAEPAGFLEEAAKLGFELEQKGIWTGDSLGWFFTGYDKRIERIQISPVDNSLYSGQAGPALFLAALAAGTGNPKFNKLAVAAWQPYFRLFKNKSNWNLFLGEEGIGGGVGAGSIIYALALSSIFLEDTRLAELALTLADFPAEIIEADRKYDLIFGSAGAIVSLLALYDCTGEKSLLETARRCARHLLASRTPSRFGLRAWVTVDQKLGTGFSHGSAGIAYALLRLYQHTGDEEFRKAAGEAIEYEDSLFSDAAGNWPYLFYQPENIEAFWTRWCHGAPGIGLGRLGGLEALDTPAIRYDIENALRTTHREGIIETDHLCCGNFGLLELQVAASTILNRPYLLQAARETASRVIDRAAKDNAGHFSIFPGNPTGLYSPAFFQGNSGIGYELLRLADPAKFPSVLLWQSQENSYVKS